MQIAQVWLCCSHVRPTSAPSARLERLDLGVLVTVPLDVAAAADDETSAVPEMAWPIPVSTVPVVAWLFASAALVLSPGSAAAHEACDCL